MTEEEYHIKFPVTDALFLKNDLSFSIENIKSRFTSTLYFIVKFYDRHDNLLYTYTSDRWVIDNQYGRRYRNFTISEDVADKTTKYQITLVASNLSSENPLYFNKVMFQEGDYIAYHTPLESDTSETGYLVKYNKCSYCNLYNNNGDYLQVIRPKNDSITTKILKKSSCTVLAPHLSDEPVIDDPIDIFLEFVNQREQKIDVLR